MAERRVVGPEGEEIEHPILSLFRAPNEDEGSFDFFESTICYLSLGGEFFWEIVPDKLNVPRELYNMRPDRVKLMLNDKNTRISHYEFSAGMEKETFNKDEVVHTKHFNPTNDFRGMPSVKPLSNIVNADKYGWRWIRSYLKRYGVSRGFLTTQSRISEPASKRLKQKWQSPGEDSNETPLLPFGIDWKDIARPPKESGLTDFMDFITQAKLSVLGVPPALAGLVETARYASYDVQLKAFYTLTVVPHLIKLEDAINRQLMPRYGEGVGRFEFDKTSIGLLDFESLVNALSDQFDRGSLTPNEFMKVTGLGEPYENGGNDHYLGERKNNVQSSREGEVSESDGEPEED
jgi:HK97 family phage portal protein